MKPRMVFVFLIGLVLLCMAAAPVTAATVTRSLTYQGTLTDAAGSPLTGAYNVSFQLYNVENGGTALGTNSRVVTVTKGLFTTPVLFDPGFFDGQALWLGISVGNDPEMAPRQEIRPVPYALNLSPMTKTISFPALSLNWPGESTVIRQNASTYWGGGLTWGPSWRDTAALILHRPAEWDGTSDITMNIYFCPVTSRNGNVAFFIRPRSFNPGDSLVDASSLESLSPVPVSGSMVLKKQTFTIPASQMSEELWFITIQNQGTGSSYPDDVNVLSVDLMFTATR